MPQIAPEDWMTEQLCSALYHTSCILWSNVEPEDWENALSAARSIIDVLGYRSGAWAPDKFESEVVPPHPVEQQESKP